MKIHKKPGFFHSWSEKLDSKTLGEQKTLLEHFHDLRKMLTVSFGAIGLVFLVLFFGFSAQLVEFLIEPLKARNIQIIYTALSESFTTQAKVSVIFAAIFASPVIFWQIWAFIRPALYPRERLIFGSLFFLGICLFILGVFFAYKAVFALAINFFVYSGEGLATPMISIDKYVGFLFGFLVPFGVMFQLPIAILIMTRLGIVNTAMLRKFRKYVIFIIFIAAAVLTPPDVISQVMLGIPLVVLYEVGIIISCFVKPRRG